MSVNWAARLVVASPMLVALAFWTSARSPFEPAKLALLLMLVGGWLVLSGRQSLTRGTVTIPDSPWARAVGAFLVVGLVASILGDNVVASLFGVPGRNTGLLAYAGAAVLGIGIAGAASLPVARIYAVALLVGLTVLGLHGLLQAGGADPIAVVSAVPGIFVTLSNPNFAGGFAGSLLGLACWQALAGVGWRRVVGMTGLGSSLLIVVGAGSVVGYAAAAASVFVVLAAWLHQRAGSLSRVGLPILTLLGLAGAGLTALGVFEQGPLAALGRTSGVTLRRYYWGAAVDMAVDNPLTGVGFDRFITAYRAYRSPAAADAVSITLETDGAHSVPLQLLSGGGFPLLVGYLAVVGLTLVAGLRAFHSVQGADRLLVAAIASVWVGLLVQSVASFDLPAHVTLQMVTSGLLAGLAWPERRREVALPTSRRTPAGGRPTQRRAKRRTARPDRAVLVLAGSLGLGLLLALGRVGTRPLSAEVAAGRAFLLDQGGEYAVAASQWQDAADRAGWEVDYPYRQALSLLRANDVAQAGDALAEAIERQPDHLPTLVTSARVAVGTDDVERGIDLYRQALRVEPTNLELKVEVAGVLVGIDNAGAAALLEEVADRQPDYAGLLELQRQLGTAE